MFRVALNIYTQVVGTFPYSFFAKSFHHLGKSGKKLRLSSMYFIYIYSHSLWLYYSKGKIAICTRHLALATTKYRIYLWIHSFVGFPFVENVLIVLTCDGSREHVFDVFEVFWGLRLMVDIRALSFENSFLTNLTSILHFQLDNLSLYGIHSRLSYMRN